MAKATRTRLKLSHAIHSRGGPWTTTTFYVSGIPVGTLKTKVKTVRDQEVAKYAAYSQEQLRALLKKRVGSMARSIEEVVGLLENLQDTAEELLGHLS